MQQKTISLITEAEYLELERHSETKNEYFQGEIFVMAGASECHNLIVSNLIIALGTQLRNKPCRVYPSDMRLKIEDAGLYTYPDVMLVCGEREFSDEKQDTLLNPDVITEVLSDSTEGYDRGAKFGFYRTLSSLREYLMISQNSQKMEKYTRNDAGQWVLTESDAEHPGILLESIDCELLLSEVYDKTDA